MSDSNKPVERYSYVTQQLTASDKFNDSQFRVLVYMLGTDSIVLENGDPFTHSAASLSIATPLERRTLERIIAAFVKLKIVKLFGTKQNGKHHYNIYSFDSAALESILKTPEKSKITKLSCLGPIATIDKDDSLEPEKIEGTTARASTRATEQASKCATRSNTVEITGVELTKVEKKENDIGLDKSQQPSRITAPVVKAMSLIPVNQNGFSAEQIQQFISEGYAKHIIEKRENFFLNKGIHSGQSKPKTSNNGFDSLN